MPFVGEHHGTAGPVKTSFNETLLPIEEALIEAADQIIDFDKKPTDPWSGDHIGFYNTLGAVSRSGPTKGKRSYAARGMFEENAHRSNLHVLCEAHAQKVVISEGRATGVSFFHGDETHEVSASCEVVVSGGTMATPQILELSGIGDPEILEAAGLECLVESKGVGNNYQEHILTGVIYELTEGNHSMDALYDPAFMESAQKQLMEEVGAPLTHIASAQDFFPYKIFATEREQNAILESTRTTKYLNPFQQKQYKLTSAHLQSDKSANLQSTFIPLSIDHQALDDQSKPFQHNPNGRHQVMVPAALQYPLSRGSIHFTSSEGKLHQRLFPAPSVDLQDTEQAKRVVEELVVSQYHACGTCAMGEVLDSELRVRGVRGLRVVDASVFPGNVSGNIVSSVYAVAERAADTIKEERKHRDLEKASA